MDEDADDDRSSGERGRLRPAWPTFRGSSVGWGVLTVAWIVNAVVLVLGMTENGWRAWGVAVLVFLEAGSVVCVVGTVSTIRRPRPGPRS